MKLLLIVLTLAVLLSAADKLTMVKVGDVGKGGGAMTVEKFKDGPVTCYLVVGYIGNGANGPTPAMSCLVVTAP